MLLGLFLLAVGAIALLVKADVVPSSVWGYAWPALLAVLGLILIWGYTSGRRYFSRFGCCCGSRADYTPEKK